MELNFERDMPLTKEDVEVLRRLRRTPTTPAAYQALLESLGHPSRETLAQRRGPRGEPFEL